MPAIGGSVESVEIRGRTFAVAADADATRDIGGFTNEVMANGNGTARLIKTRKPWKIDGLSLAIDDIRGDHEFLQEIADGHEFVDMSVTFANGLTYQGSGTVAGDLGTSSQSATGALSLSGEGTLTQQ